MISNSVLVRDLGRSFRTGFWLSRKTVALASVSMDVPQGATLGLVGPNGSGKSTLLRLLAGVDRPTTGSIGIFGNAPTDVATKKRLAFLPDGQPFPPELKALDALHLIASLKGLSRAERRTRVPAMLERVGLGDRKGTRLGAFSRGMHRRFGLGQAFIAKPDIVLLDEPTAGLDAPGFEVLNDVLSEARQREATVILASHVASDLVEHCTHVKLLSGGRLLREGTPDELLGESGTLEMRIRGGDAAPMESALRGAAENAGGEVLSVRNARRSLIELYRDIERTRDDEQGTGSAR